MPTYEFRCPDGHEFEKFYRSISGAESQASCPVCGKPAERMLSAAGFAFKGSGFYLTDYGKNAHRGEAPPTAKAEASSPGESSSESTKADSTKTDATAATKTDSSKNDSAKASESSSSSTESKKTESKKPEPKPESKPAPTAPKSSGSE
ncbi:MAG: zinc ribbon domain-containing protein [bacterium]